MIKWSKYNIIFNSKKNKHLLYNSLTNSFIEFSESDFNKILEIKNNLIKNKQIKSNKVIEQLLENKILTNDNDDFLLVKQIILNHRFDPSSLDLTIAPTQDCNFNCSYCYEGNRPSIYMDDKTEAKLIEFIESFNKVNTINITWYGGEPLLDFDRMISITNKVKKLNKHFYSDIVTNGYLMNADVISNLENLNIKSIQITIDGNKSTHDKQRPLKNGDGTFETIIKNIDTLMQHSISNEIELLIRVNIDKNNQEEYVDLNNYFLEKYPKKNISLYPGIIRENNGFKFQNFSNSGGCKSTSDYFIKADEKAETFINLYNKYNVKMLPLYPKNMMYACTARKQNSFLIDPKGNIFKCWEDMGDDSRIISNIHSLEKVNNDLLNRYLYAADPLDDEKCKNCSFLPICGGGCPVARLRHEYFNEKNDFCVHFKNHIKEFLEIYYEIKQKNL